VEQGGKAHTHNSLLGGNGTGREKAENDVEAADPRPSKQSARQKYREGAGTRMLGVRQTIGEPGCDVVAGEHQTATGTGRQKQGSAGAEIMVRDRRLRRPPGLRRGREVRDRQGQQLEVNLRNTGESCM